MMNVMKQTRKLTAFIKHKLKWNDSEMAMSPGDVVLCFMTSKTFQVTSVLFHQLSEFEEEHLFFLVTKRQTQNKWNSFFCLVSSQNGRHLITCFNVNKEEKGFVPKVCSILVQHWSASSSIIGIKIALWWTGNNSSSWNFNFSSFTTFF